MPSLSCQMHLSIPSVAVSREYDMKKIGFHDLWHSYHHTTLSFLPQIARRVIVKYPSDVES